MQVRKCCFPSRIMWNSCNTTRIHALAHPNNCMWSTENRWNACNHWNAVKLPLLQLASYCVNHYNTTTIQMLLWKLEIGHQHRKRMTRHATELQMQVECPFLDWTKKLVPTQLLSIHGHEKNLSLSYYDQKFFDQLWWFWIRNREQMKGKEKN
jgi:hypothetical protein